MRYDDYWYENQDEVYRDIRVEDVVFPEHMEDQNGECITYSVEWLKENN